MNIAQTVLKNVAASWVGFAVQLSVTFLLTPVVIRELGTEAYGVWILLQGLVGYYGLVDLGLQAGLTQSITRRIAAGDIAAVRRHIAASIPLLSGFSGLVMLLALMVALLLPRFIDISPTLADSIWLIVLPQAIGAAAKMPIAPYGAVLVGLQRYDVSNAISIFTRIIFAVSTWWVLRASGGLVGLSLVLMLTNLLDSAIRVIVARKMLPGICGAGISLDRSELSEIANVGAWNFMIGTSRQFIYFSDAVTIGLLFSARAVAPYGIAASFVEYGNSLIVNATMVLFPAMTQISKGGDLKAQRELYIIATRLTLGLSLTILVLGVAWIVPFLSLWLDKSDENLAIREQAPLIFAVLGAAFTFVGFQRAGIQLLLADNRLQLLAILMTIEAVLNLVLSLAFGWLLGPIGVAIGTLIPAIALGIFVHIPIHAKALETSYLSLLANVTARPLIYFLTLATAIFTVRLCFPSPTNWGSLFLLAGILSPAIALILLPSLPSSAQTSEVIRTVRRKLFARSRVSPIS